MASVVRITKLNPCHEPRLHSEVNWMQQEDKGDWWEGIIHLLPLFLRRWWWCWWWDGELQLNQTNWVACRLILTSKWSCSFVWGTSCRLLTKGQASPSHKGPDSQKWRLCSSESPLSPNSTKERNKKGQLPDWLRPNPSPSLNLRLLGNRYPQTDITGRDSGASYPTLQRPPNLSFQVVYQTRRMYGMQYV